MSSEYSQSILIRYLNKTNKTQCIVKNKTMIIKTRYARTWVKETLNTCAYIL